MFPQQFLIFKMCSASKCLQSIILLLEISWFANAAYLRIYDGSINAYDEFDLDSPLDLLSSSGYNPTRDTVVYVFGFNGKADGDSIKTVVETYMRLGGYNIVLLNWEKEASSSLGFLEYPATVTEDVNRIGIKFGEALVKLVSAGLDVNGIHLIGFSLGAHLVGYAGREVQKYDLKIPRITGLEPAGPLYDQGLSKSLTSECAEFVEAFHSNPGGLGTVRSLGTVDIWFNCKSNIQPGCEDQSDPKKCSHDRSWQYYSEILVNPNSFEAVSASSCRNWMKSNVNEDTIYFSGNYTLGHYGNFYLRTNSKPPYGKGSSGVFANDK